jgi:N-methylhydantoinase A
MTARVGIDTGGTFSDFVLIDEDTGAVRTAKVPSTPADPPRAIRAGLAQLGATDFQHIVIGTTVATNAVVQRHGPKVVYLTNEGFTDVPFIGRIDKERLYDLHWQKPKPLVHRRDCYGIRGRIDHHGEEIEPLDLTPLKSFLEGYRLDGDELAVAICCLFSYLRGEHEQEIAALVRAALPEAFVSVSHEVSPVWREYERASTTITDAFVKPVVSGYVDAVSDVLRTDTRTERWNLLSSNGGHLRAEQARQRPAQLLLSGLAGGVAGAAYYASAVGEPSVFSLDMGGTSCDIGLVLDGSEQYASEFNVLWGVPVTIPCVAVTTIGAGGGSIAWVDKGGLLRVGPQSAGADPGPVAYGTGGDQPTLTDANLTLQRLDPDYFLGGRMEIDGEAAVDAFARLGDSLGLDAEAAALAAVRIADENMANAIRLIAVERGLDPRQFALIAFGGAGPLHARAVAERLDIPRVIVPLQPGLCSAFGAAIAQARVDRVQTYYARSSGIDIDELARVARALREETVAELRRSVDVPQPLLEQTAAMRYMGQNYELEVPLPEGDLDVSRWQELLARFEDEHERQFGFRLPDETVEIVNLRVTALRPERRLELALGPHGDKPPQSRQVWFDGRGAVECAVVRRDTLRAGDELAGPCVIEEADSTTLVHPGDRVRVDASGVLVLTLGEAP